MSDPRRILVCRLSALGDIVLTLPVVEALRDRYPRARIGFLSREPFGRILSGVRAIDTLSLWPGKGHDVPAELRDESWDLVVDLSGSGRSRRLLQRIRSRRTLRIGKQTLRRFAFVRLRAVGGSSVRLAPVLDRLFGTVAPLGILRGGRAPRFDQDPPPADGPVLLAPGAGRETKRWPEERFAQVARRLAERGRRVRIVGTAAEREILERVGASVAPDLAEVIAGPDPADLPSIAGRCPVALTNDSGLLHVAEACGARVVALFGPTHPRLGFAPHRRESLAIHGGISCSPCDLHGPHVCPRGHHRCLRDVTVEDVLEALIPLLSVRAAS